MLSLVPDDDGARGARRTLAEASDAEVAAVIEALEGRPPADGDHRRRGDRAVQETYRRVKAKSREGKLMVVTV